MDFSVQKVHVLGHNVYKIYQYCMVVANSPKPNSMLINDYENKSLREVILNHVVMK